MDILIYFKDKANEQLGVLYDKSFQSCECYW